MSSTELIDAVKGVKERFDDFMSDSDKKAAALQERIEMLEAANGRPGKTGKASESDTERRYEGLGKIVKGMAEQKPELKAEGEKLLTKAVEGTTATAGGNAVEDELGAAIWRELRSEPGIISLVRQVETDTAPSSHKTVVSDTGTSSGWIGETGTRTETDTPVFNLATPTDGMLYAYPSITEEMLAGSVYDLGEFLVSEAREEFRKQLSQAIISGNGTNKPTGLTNAAPVSTADDASPRRAYNVLEYLPTGAASGFQTEPYQQPSPLTDPMACFWNTMAALKSQYRRNARWVMNSTTLAAIGKLRDVDGKSLFSPNPAVGAPMSLLGYPIVIDEYVADLGSNAFPIFFGDLSQTYKLVTNFATRLTVDEISTKGYFKYYLRSYVGGCPVKGEGTKVIKCATS